MNMVPVISDNVAAAGYEPQTRTLRVQFHSGGVYDYFDVDPALFEQLLLPHPWRRIGRIIRSHAYRRVRAA